MPHFFIQNEGVMTPGESLTIRGEDARHIALSLRMAAGEELTASNGVDAAYRCRLTSITPDSVSAEILSVEQGRGEPPLPIHIYMAYPKGDKLETVIQKATELGASDITPFFSERCIRRPAEEKNKRLTERYNKIAREAAGQCLRTRVPTVHAPLAFGEMLKAAAAASLPLFCYEGSGTRPLPALLPKQPPASISVIVGSEGGFSPAEAAAAEAAGLWSVGLGSRILRCETAPLFVLSCLSCFYEIGQNR